MSISELIKYNTLVIGHWSNGKIITLSLKRVTFHDHIIQDRKPLSIHADHVIESNILSSVLLMSSFETCSWIMNVSFFSGCLWESCLPKNVSKRMCLSLWVKADNLSLFFSKMNLNKNKVSWKSTLITYTFSVGFFVKKLHSFQRIWRLDDKIIEFGWNTITTSTTVR